MNLVTIIATFVWIYKNGKNNYDLLVRLLKLTDLIETLPTEPFFRPTMGLQLETLFWLDLGTEGPFMAQFGGGVKVVLLGLVWYVSLDGCSIIRRRGTMHMRRPDLIRRVAGI